MLFSISWGLALGLVVLTVLKMPKPSQSVAASEESAHSAAAAKRSHALDTRREPRFRSDQAASASVLGESSRHSSCRIVNTSRSGIRIVSAREFVKGSQVCVQWGDEFFVGTALYSFPQKDEYVAGLELVSGNYHWHPFERFCFWRRSA